MASPVLLVADDLSTIAAVKRVLGREGYEVILATNAADAVIAWGHSLPGLILLQPSVEGDRGPVVLEELQAHPDSGLLRVVLLGETMPGFGYPVEPLPIDPVHFAETLTESMRATIGSGKWKVHEPAPRTTAPPAPMQTERDDWRATAPTDPSEPGHDETTPNPDLPPLEDTLFNDLSLDESVHRDIEAEAMASVESSLAQRDHQDDELRQLEDDVRAEAKRRRAAREQRSPEVIIKQAQATLTGEEELSFFASTPNPPLLSSTSRVIPPPGIASVAFGTSSIAEVSEVETAAADESDFQLGDGEASSSDSQAHPSAPVAAADAHELLARAEAMVLESRAVTDANRRADENETRHAAAELETLTRQLENAEAQSRHERAAWAASEESAQSLHTRLEQLQAELKTERRETELARTQYNDSHEELEAERQMAESLQRAVDTGTQTNEQLTAQLAALTTELERVFEGLKTETDLREALEAQLKPLENVQHDFERMTELNAQVVQERDALQQQAVTASADAERALALSAQLDATIVSLQSAKSRAGELAERVVTLESSLSVTRSASHESTNEREVLKGDVDRLSNELGDAAASVTRLTSAVAQLREALEAAASRAELAEAGAQLAAERIKELEHRATMPLAMPGRRPLGVARSGQVDLEGLAQLIAQLVIAQADVRLELGVEGGSRVLWFKKGSVIAAESSLPHETLIDRARRDGLIDARQEAELRLLKHAAANEQLQAMRSRMAIRDVEAVPLAQRFTEFVALEAFAEESTQYRLADEVPSADTLQASVPRATLPMLAEAIRRALPVDALLQKLGGGEAVCEPLETDLDLRALGFSDRERKMLSWVDGETTVEDLALASGLKQDAAFRSLLVAKLLGVISVAEPKERPAEPSGDLEIQRLDAKYDEVLEADYFTILGLPKSAGTDDVQRAFSRLSSEFDPLKYSGHPDPALQQRAQVVFTHLEEAAKALEDDRRRSDYARHLLD